MAKIEKEENTLRTRQQRFNSFSELLCSHLALTLDKTVIL